MAEKKFFICFFIYLCACLWKEVTHSNGSYERKSRRRELADEMGHGKKSHDTLIDWCTRREWPLNCMTVISAWWWSNMPFQGLSGRLSGRWTEISWSRRQDVVEKAQWRGPLGALGAPDELELETRCGRESYTRPKGPSGPPVVSEIRWWQDVVQKASTQHKAEPLGLWLSSPGEQERHNADGHKNGGQNIAVLFGLQLPLTRKPWVTLFEPLQ